MFAECHLCVEGPARHAAQRDFRYGIPKWIVLKILEEFSWMICDDFLFSNFCMVECCSHLQRVYSLRLEL